MVGCCAVYFLLVFDGWIKCLLLSSNAGLVCVGFECVGAVWFCNLGLIWLAVCCLVVALWVCLVACLLRVLMIDCV